MLTLGWGCNWPMMKIALMEMPVLSFRALCLAVGAAGMFAIAGFGGHAIMPRRKEWTNHGH